MQRDDHMPAMKFEKQNHHYVPQYWQRGFRGSSGHLYGRFDSGIRPVSTKTVMQSDWLYTLFDDRWNPSDALEDAFAAVEAEDAKLFRRLHIPGYVTTADDRDHLCSVFALQASRHPDVLGRGHRLGKELGVLLANAHALSLDEFQQRIAAFGVSAPEAQNCYVDLCSRTKEQLSAELAELIGLSPQSSQLPAQDAIRAMPVIEEAIKRMELYLLDAVPPMAFVLGDTPIPQSHLGRGFSVPLSQSLAVLAVPVGIQQTSLSRRVASSTEVQEINRTQYENALEVVVGPSVGLLASL
jgi:hypothetical protein